MAAVTALAAAASAAAADHDAASAVPSVSETLVPFEPPAWAFYSPNNKFLAPPEEVAPKVMWPLEMRHGFTGSVVVLVRIDMSGYPRELHVLSSDHKYYAREAVRALEHARWKPDKRQVWFYYRIVFDPDQMLRDG